MKLSQELIGILAVGATMFGLQIAVYSGLRSEVRDEIGGLRREVRDEISVLREDIHHDIDGLRIDIQDIREDVRQLREKLLVPAASAPG